MQKAFNCHPYFEYLVLAEESQHNFLKNERHANLEGPGLAETTSVVLFAEIDCVLHC